MRLGSAPGLLAILLAAAAGCSTSAPTSSTSPPDTTSSLVPDSSSSTSTPSVPSGSNVSPVSLDQMMPDPQALTGCKPIPLSSFPYPVTGLVESEGCGIENMSGWAVNGYRFDNDRDFQNGYYAALKQNLQFDKVTPSMQCPPASGYSVGESTWQDSTYPSTRGQDVVCGTFTILGNPLPQYYVLIPTRDAYIVESSDSSSSLSALEFWFNAFGGPR